MKSIHLLATIVIAFTLASCSTKAPDFVNSIPDDAFAVVSLHPMQIHQKGRINSLQGLKKMAKDELWSMVLEDPTSTGLMMNEYSFLFVSIEDENPLIGMVSGLKNEDKFIELLKQIREGIEDDFQAKKGYTMVQPDEEGVVAWNDKQVILLLSPDRSDLEESFWTTRLSAMFNPVKEKSITSLVDFKDFMGKMKDLNFWVASDQLSDLIEKLKTEEEMEINFPFDLYNNYIQIYCDFADGALYVDSETHFSEEVEKNIESFLVMKPELNKEMLKMAPGGNLLLGMAISMDLDKLSDMIKRIAPPELDETGDKLEALTGVATNELIDALTGDLTLAVNGIEGEAMIPIELFIGLGIESEAIQEKLMETLKGKAPVKESGDFFVINVQGTEIYSGIINNTWVLTNAKGYQKAMEGSGPEKNLLNSRFGEFASGSSGLYLNLDLESYPMMIHTLLSSQPEKKKIVENLTGPFESLGGTASNYESHMVLKTNKPQENSLYTILRISEETED